MQNFKDSLLIRHPAKSIKTSRSFSTDFNGLWKMPCITARSLNLLKYTILKQAPRSFSEMRYVSNSGGPQWSLAHGAHGGTVLGVQTGGTGVGMQQGLHGYDNGLMPLGWKTAGKRSCLTSSS